MEGQVARPLLTAPEIQAEIAPQIFQGVSSSDSGTIYFPDTILAVTVDALEGDGQKIVDEWSKSHLFVMVPFVVGVQPAKEKKPASVDVTAAFADVGDIRRQPIVNAVFPETGFEAGAFSGSGELKITADGKFEPLPADLPGVKAGAGLSGNAALKFDYSPAYASVISGFGSGHAFWQFKRSKDRYPVGSIHMKLLIGVPRGLGDEALTIDFDVRVDFGGSWFGGGSAVTNFSSLVQLPAAR